MAQIFETSNKLFNAIVMAFDDTIFLVMAFVYSFGHGFGCNFTFFFSLHDFGCLFTPNIPYIQQFKNR